MKTTRWFPLVSCLVLALGCTTTPTEIKVPMPSPKVGDTSTDVKDMTLTFVQTRPGVTVSVAHTEHSQEVREVLAVDGGVVTRAKVTYKAAFQTETAGDERQERKTLLAGKSYLVWRENGELEASRATGGTLPADERAAVLEDNRTLGRPEAMERIIASKRWKLGAKIDFTAAELAELDAHLAGTVESEMTAMALTPTRTDGDTATFAVATTMRVTDADGTLEMSLTGTQTLDLATARTSMASLSGPFHGDAGKPVTGTISIDTVSTY